MSLSASTSEPTVVFDPALSYLTLDIADTDREPSDITTLEVDIPHTYTTLDVRTSWAPDTTTISGDEDDDDDEVCGETSDHDPEATTTKWKVVYETVASWWVASTSSTTENAQEQPTTVTITMTNTLSTCDMSLTKSRTSTRDDGAPIDTVPAQDPGSSSSAPTAVTTITTTSTSEQDPSATSGGEDEGTSTTPESEPSETSEKEESKSYTISARKAALLGILCVGLQATNQLLQQGP